MYRIGLFITFWLPLSVAAMPYEEARHLLSRTGFGPNQTEIEALMKLDYPAAVDQLLSGTAGQARTPPPDWVENKPPRPGERRSLTDEQKQQRRKQIFQWGQELKSWWYREMISTTAPLAERMTLLWHNHFTSSLSKVKWTPFLYRQNKLLRQHATGNFGELLRAVSRDPAMLIYLDNARSRSGNPNENFARELLELFTLGEGHYQEEDVRAAARAFTGWTLNRNSGEFRYAQRWHDSGEKTFLGRTGNWDGDDILDILLQQPQLAQHISEKLWKEFVSPQPDEKEITRMAAVFRNSGYEIKPLLRELLLSKAFRKPSSYGSLIKSPVELLVGSVRVLDIPVQDSTRLARAGRLLGQDLFNPPNVKGWQGGTAWIDSATLLNRQMVIAKITRAPGVQQAMLAIPRTAPLAKLLLPVPATETLPDTLEAPQRVSALLHDPAYQLK